MTTKTSTITRDIDTLEALELDDVKLDLDVEIVKRRVASTSEQEQTEEPKSLHELWVMNDKKFPFTAVRVVSPKVESPAGQKFTLIGAFREDAFLIPESQYFNVNGRTITKLWNNFKGWQLA